jgi:hypothetical protein
MFGLMKRDKGGLHVIVSGIRVQKTEHPYEYNAKSQNLVRSDAGDGLGGLSRAAIGGALKQLEGFTASALRKACRRGLRQGIVDEFFDGFDGGVELRLRQSEKFLAQSQDLAGLEGRTSEIKSILLDCVEVKAEIFDRDVLVAFLGFHVRQPGQDCGPSTTLLGLLPNGSARLDKT